MIYTRQRIAILRILHDAADPLTTQEIARLAGADPYTVSANMDVWIGMDWIQSEGDRPKRSGLVRRFTLTPRGHANVETLLKHHVG